MSNCHYFAAKLQYFLCICIFVICKNTLRLSYTLFVTLEVYIYLQRQRSHSVILFSLPLLFIRCLLSQGCHSFNLLSLPLPLLFIFSTCKSSTEVVTIGPSTIPADGSKSTLVSVGPVEVSSTSPTVEESSIIETTAQIPSTNVFNSTEGVAEHKAGWYRIHTGRSTSFKAADLIELSPLVESILMVDTLFIRATEVESEALFIAYYSRTSVAGKAPANLQELRIGCSLKIFGGEVKVFIFGVHIGGIEVVKLFIFGIHHHVGGIKNIVVFEGVSGDSCA